MFFLFFVLFALLKPLTTAVASIVRIVRSFRVRSADIGLTCQHDEHDRSAVVDDGAPRIDQGDRVLGVGLAARTFAERHRRVARLPQQKIVLGKPADGDRRRVQERDDFQRSVAHVGVL